MSGVPGAGLLALLRKRSEPAAEAAAPTGASPIAAAASRFEARSSAVHALEHAVAAGTVAEAARPAAQGRRIPPGPSYAYDVDVHAPHEAQPQLPVTPVTLINTDYALKHHRQIAACPAYIAYGLKQGHIRVLSRTSALRALLKGHSKPLTDLAFAPASAGGSAGTLLASGAADGQLYVWELRVDDDAGAIHDTQKLHASFVASRASAGDVFLSWHSPGTLAAGVGGHVLLVSVPREGMEQLEFDLSEESTPDATVLPDWSGEPVSCLAFSPDGALLAAGGGDGGVSVWHLRGTGGSPALEVASSATLPSPPGGGPIGAVRWLAASEDSGYVLLAGNKNNTALQLWHTPAADNPWALLQTLTMQGKDGPSEFFIHVEAVPGQPLVVLADTARKAIYTLHFTGEGSSLRFDYVARFGVAVPILSFTAGWNPAGGGEHDAAAVELACVQTTAIQQYSLDPLLCHDGAAPEDDFSGDGEEEHSDGIVPRSSLLERDGRQLGIKPQPSEAVPMPSAELASGTPTPRSANASPSKLEDARPAAPAVAAEPSIEGAVSLAGIPLPPAPQDADAGAGDGEEELEPKGASGEITPEECPSPPPTPNEQRRLNEAAAAAAANAAPAPVAPAQPPRLLTPSDLLQSASTSAATTGRSSPAAAAGSATPAAVPPPAAATGPAVAEEAEEDEEPLASPLAAAAAPAVAPAAAPAAGAAALDEAAVAAAVAGAMGGVHKKFVGHVSLMYRELLKAMKAEMSAQAAAQQAALAQLLAATAESQKQQIEAERAAVLAEERASIERLLTAISATLNRDLPTKLAEAVRGELAGLADGVAAAVAPSVQASVAGTLQKELGGAVKAGLDRQLSGAVAAGVAKPLQEAVRTAFTKQVVPALEGATQAAFRQVDAALAAGLEEHLQASRAALSEPAQLAAQLAASLSSAQSLAAALSQGQQQLLRAQSMGTGGTRSPAAPADARGELAALLRKGSYEAAFSKALGLQDVATVGWLAAQADAATVLSRDPCPLSQMVLLSLVQQLSADLTTDLGAKLAWIREAAMLINPRDPLLSRHVRPVLDGVHSALQACAARVTGAEASSCRLAMHVVHSQLTS